MRIRLCLLSTSLKARKECYDIFQDLKVYKYLAKASIKISRIIRIFPGIPTMSTMLTVQKTLKRVLYIGEEKDSFTQVYKEKNVFHGNNR